MGIAPGRLGQDRRRRALLVVNEKSRAGKTAADEADALLAAAGLTVRHERADQPGDLEDLIRRNAGTVDCFVLGGGDGTFSAAAGALIDADRPVGLLPLGTGNDLARTLAIPFDMAKAVDVIAAGKTRRIDVGAVNGRPFFNVASLGLSARLTDNLTSDTKRRWGRLGYAVALARTLVRARPFSAVIRANGREYAVRTLQIAVGNGRHYGAGMTVEENARIDDGMLDLYSLEFDQPWRLLLIYPAFRKGRHGVWKQVRTLKTNSAEILTHRPHTIDTDGELTTRTPATFKVLRRALQVYVPAE